MEKLLNKLQHSEANSSLKEEIKKEFQNKPQELFKYFSHPDWKIRYEIFKILLSFNSKIIDFILENMDSENEDIFYWTLKLATKNKSKQIIEKVFFLLNQEECPTHRKKLLLEFFANNSFPPPMEDVILQKLLPFFNSREWILRKTLEDVLLSWEKEKVIQFFTTTKIEEENSEYWFTRTLLELKVFNEITEEFFLKRLTSENTEIIKLALHFLEIFKPKSAVEPLLKLLSHSNWGIRRFSAEILCEYGECVIPHLEVFLQKNPSDDAKYWISRILGEIEVNRKNKRDILRISLELLQEASPYIRSSAIITIGKLGNQKDIRKILRFHKDENVEVRKSLALALNEKKPGKEAQKTLQKLLDDPDEWVVKYAQMARDKFFSK